jgi:hypothetical protein
VVAEEFGTAAAPLRFDRLEHVRHLARVVPGARHDLRAQHVGLRFIFAAVLQEVRAEPEL